MSRTRKTTVGIGWWLNGILSSYSFADGLASFSKSEFIYRYLRKVETLKLSTQKIVSGLNPPFGLGDPKGLVLFWVSSGWDPKRDPKTVFAHTLYFQGTKVEEPVADKVVEELKSIRQIRIRFSDLTAEDNDPFIRIIG